MSTSPSSEPASNLSDIRRKLIWRMAVAGIMIAGLLGGLAFFDYLGNRLESEPEIARYTEPVPVAKKSVTQPVTPIVPATEVKDEKKEVTAPEVTAPPTDKAAPRLDTPSRPEVAASPAVTKSSPAVSRGATVAAPASRVAAKTSEPRSAAQAAPPEVAETSTAMSRPSFLKALSGFALQAGVFSDSRRAEELHARLTLEGIPSSIEARVQVGPFKSKEEAEAARSKMKAMGIDAVMLAPIKARR